MLEYRKSESEWYALPRSERLLMAATLRARRALDAMQNHDNAEYHRKEAERKRRAKGGR